MATPEVILRSSPLFTDAPKAPENERDRTLALIAPGQGGQKVGMGVDLARRSRAAAEIWAIAEEELGRDFMRVLREGSQEVLNLTQYAQPAIVLDSLARYAAMREQGLYDIPQFVSGNSLGFYTAVVLAGGITVREGFKLVEERGRISQESNNDTPSSMVAFVGVSDGMRQRFEEEFGLVLCLDNSRRQKVYGGEKGNVIRAVEWASTQPQLEDCVFLLSVDGAFHSRFKLSAVEPLRKTLDSITLYPPTRSTLIGIDNVKPITTEEELREELLGQLIHPVRWRETIEFMMANGVHTLVELGERPRLTQMHSEDYEGDRQRLALPKGEDGSRGPTIAHLWKEELPQAA